MAHLVFSDLTRPVHKNPLWMLTGLDRTRVGRGSSRSEHRVRSSFDYGIER
jgi:hypothetical protein